MPCELLSMSPKPEEVARAKGNLELLTENVKLRRQLHSYEKLYIDTNRLTRQNKELQDKIALFASKREMLMQTLSTIGDSVTKVTS